MFHSSVATLYTLDSQVGGATNERNPHDQPVGGCPQASGSMQETPSIPHAGHQRSSGTLWATHASTEFKLLAVMYVYLITLL